MSQNWYIGRRVSYEGHLCTVRYVGPLPGQKGEWLGVEWDDPARGKHNGLYKDNQIFQCLSPSSAAASFVRPTRTPDIERSVLEAIEHKYGHPNSNENTGNDVVIISGKVAEEVGFEKVAQEQARLAELRIVLIDELSVAGVAARGSGRAAVKQAQETLSATCPKVTELHVGYNPLETWQDVADICSALPELRILRAGGSRFRALNLERTNSTTSFARLRELHIEECLLSPPEILQLFEPRNIFPQLEHLTISGNALSTFPAKDTTRSNEKITTLTLENNLFKDLDFLHSLTRIFPHTSTISLQNNQISNLGARILESQTHFSHITTLNLSHNAISSYSFVDGLPSIFPKLSSLRINHNPLYSHKPTEAASHDTKASEKSFYLTLARIPSLKSLNYTTITTRDREEGEIYYLSVTEKEMSLSFTSSPTPDATKRASLADQAQKAHPQYNRLATKHARENIITTFLTQTPNKAPDNALLQPPQATLPPGTLASRMIKATFYIPSEHSLNAEPKAQATLNIVRTLVVTTLKAKLCHHPAFAAYLSPLAFRLIYESQELDPVEMTTESSTRSQLYRLRGEGARPDERPQSESERWKEWGDWDADAMVERALAEGKAGHKEDVGEEHWTDDGYLVRDGRRWKKREVEILTSLKRAWGDVLEDEVREARIRIEPFEWPRLEDGTDPR